MWMRRPFLAYLKVQYAALVWDFKIEKCIFDSTSLASEGMNIQP